MNRRITAALMALMILVCALPVSAQTSAEDYADCRIYEIGTIYDPYEKVWVNGRTPPLEEDAGEDHHWEQFGRIYREGCGKTEHPRHTEECYAYVEGVYQQICPLEIHTHNIYCKVYNAQYLWHVVPDVPQTPVVPPVDPSEPSEEPAEPGGNTGNSGFEGDPGDISLVVQSLNGAGQPLEKVSFRLVRERTDEEGNVVDIDGNPVVDRETQIPALDVVAEDLLWTNAEGKVRFNALEEHMEEHPLPWLVIQDGSAFVSGGAHYDMYYTNDSQWSVDIDDSENVSVELWKPCGIIRRDEQTVPEGYSNGVLTYVNDRIRSVLDISVEFEGLPKDEAQTGSFGVTVSRDPEAEDFPKTVWFPAENSTRNYKWGTSLEDLSSGTYTLTVEEPAAISGYKHLQIQILLLNEQAGAWEEVNMATLGSSRALATFKIIYTYEYDGSAEPVPDPQEDPANTISIITVDELNRGVPGAEYKLTDDQGNVRTLSAQEEQYLLNDLAKVAEAGKTYTLEQSKAPLGYHLATDRYTIAISEEGNVTLAKENGEDSIQSSPEGWQVAKFTNRRKTAQIRLTCEDVIAQVDAACWNVEQTRQELESRAHTFCLSWTDDNGTAKTETMTLEEGKSGAFAALLPLGTRYQVEVLEDEAFSWSIEEKTIARSKSSGTIMAYQTGETPVELGATIRYTVVPGDRDLPLTMRRMDKAEDAPLAGAKFVLRDAHGNAVGSPYVTGENGYFVLENVFTEPGSRFTLREETAPEGFNKVEGDIEIRIGLDYRLCFVDEAPALKQVLKETVTHDAVEATANGAYHIMTLSKKEEAVKANTILIKALGSDGKTLTGEYQLTREGQTRTINADTGYTLEDLLEYAGGDAAYTLKQTKIQGGYQLSKAEYTVEVSQKEGTVTLKGRNQDAKVETGDNGEQIAVFTNAMEAGAKIQVSCDSVTVKLDDKCWDKEQTKKDFEARKHVFWLEIKDSSGGWKQVESMNLGKGEKALFETELFFGTEYRVTCDSYGFICAITPNTGIIGQEHLGKTITHRANITYTIQRGDNWVDVYLRKVSYWGRQPLSDAKFVLRDEDDDIIETYITKDDGHIDIEGIFLEAGRTYDLKELKAPEGYVKLNRPIEIKIVRDYRVSPVNPSVIEQVLTEQISHESVQKMSDGTYIIINKRPSDIPQTGDGFQGKLWAGLLVTSAVGLAIAAADMIRRRRRTES